MFYLLISHSGTRIPAIGRETIISDCESGVVALAPIKTDDMYNGLLILHSLLRWVLLILALIAIFKSFTGMTGGRPFTAGDKKTGLFLMITAHTQLLVGLILYFTGPWGLANIRNLGFGVVMKDPVYRFYAVEHIFGMLVAIVLITIGRGAAKKAIPDAAKHRRSFWFFLVALVIILATIPWPMRAVGAGRGWLW